MTAAPQAIDQLVAIFTAGLTDVDVIDGPVVTGSEPNKRLYVGYDGDPDGEFTGASSDQNWLGSLGAKRREESLTIPCSVVVRNGGGNVKAARDDVDAVFESVSTIMRDNINLGFGPPTTAQIRNPTLSYWHDPNTGLDARIAFDVEVSNVRF